MYLITAERPQLWSEPIRCSRPREPPCETSPGTLGNALCLYLLLVQFMEPLSRFLFVQRDLFQRKSPVL